MKRTRKKKIGVIGTRATIASQAYEKAIKETRSVRRGDLAGRVPFLCLLLKRGWRRTRSPGSSWKNICGELRDSAIDVLVMGCTHYPILEPRIRELLGDEVHIVNSGRETAAEVQRMLQTARLPKNSGKGGSDYFVTDAPDKLSDLGGRVLGEPLKRVKLVRLEPPLPPPPA